MILGYVLMALLALPRALKDFCYLFEYSSHYLSGIILHLLPSNISVDAHTSTLCSRHINALWLHGFHELSVLYEVCGTVS